MDTQTAKLRCVYCDLDGTLLGKAGSLFHDGEGKPSLMGARAIEACTRADVEFVIYSGRNQRTVADIARFIGQTSYIFEVGCGVVVDGEEELLTDGLVPRDGVSIHEQITQSGVIDQLKARYEGLLEDHNPWHHNRDISHLFRGSVDIDEVNAFLASQGHGSLRLIDNGLIRYRSPTLRVEGDSRAYHLIPAGASKGRAVARHMQIRSFSPNECIAIGDSREDLGAAEAVGTFWFVGNALRRDPGLKDAARDWPTLRVAEAEYGAGVYEAVMETLAVRS